MLARADNRTLPYPPPDRAPPYRQGVRAIRPRSHRAWVVVRGRDAPENDDPNRAGRAGAAARLRDPPALRRDRLDLGKRRALGVFERVRIYDSTASWTAPRLVGTARDCRLTLEGVSP